MSMRGAIDFSGLTSFLGQFDDAKFHLFRSQREFLLAVRAVVDTLLTLQKDRGIEDSATNALLILRTVIDYLVSRVPDDETDGSDRSRIDALRSVKDVLDMEEKRLSAFANDELIAAKIEAIQSIRKVVVTEMKRIEEEAKRKDKARVRKVDIE